MLYPDPKTSGGARWNINAIYGAGLLKDKAKGGGPDRKAARELLAAVQARVVNMDSSGRQSMATFERGTGDAVVTYENELLLQRKKTGAEAPYVIPPATLLIESPAAVVEASVERHGNREVAEAFLDFLRSDEGQRDPGRLRVPAPRPPARHVDGPQAVAPRPLHDRRPGGLGQDQQRGLRPGRGLGLALHPTRPGELTRMADLRRRRPGCWSEGPRSPTWG